MLALALVHADRAQPPLQRHGLHHRGLDGLPGLQRRHPVRERLPLGDAAAARLHHFCVGKWHLTPAEQISAAGPYDRWPLGRGFERYYGFLGGDTHQYYPDLVYDNHQVEPPKTPEEGYHLTVDLADKAIEFIADLKQVAPDKPFFLYFATGANHAPHHVPKEWADKYKGKFDDGWDAYREKVFARQKELGIVAQGRELSRHDPDVQHWDELSADERRLYARMMEVFAGFFEHTDHQIGRLIDFLESMGELDNTLIMVISDNGASAEGGPHGSVNENKFFNNVPDDLQQNLAALDELGGPKYFNHYPWGWTFAGNTPSAAGSARPTAAACPTRSSCTGPRASRRKGEIRNQYAHAIDMVPTVLDALGIEPPTRDPRRDAVADRGRQLRAHLRRRRSADQPSHPVLRDVRPPRDLSRRLARGVPVPRHVVRRGGRGFGKLELTEDKLRELDATGWELYHVDGDPAETKNLAAKERAKLIEMIALWYTEAGKYNVLPLDSRGTHALRR